MIDDFRPVRQSTGRDVHEPETPNTNTEPTFQPPEVVAAAEAEFPAPSPLGPQQPQPAKRRRLRMPQLSKKQWMLVGLASVVVLGGGGAAAYQFVFQKPAPPPAPAAVKVEEKPAEPPKPTTVASPLTGIQVKPEEAQKPVIGVMIENSPDARPQSGLKEAGIVYEAIAEGGITRFLALYQESNPESIGPIRSARPYYVEWLMGYDAAIAHVGGSPEALALIKSEGVKDMDQFYNATAYRRVSNKYAPHNVYSSMAALSELSAKKGYTKSTFTGFARKEAKPSATPTAKTIDVKMSGYLYNSHYDYDASTNTYKRSEGGKPHNDEKSGAQLTPNVVVVMVVPFGIKSDGLHSDYKTIGSGVAYIFQDGLKIEGTWEKRSAKDPIRFGDANGAPIGLNAGQTWISAVSSADKVASAP